MSDESNGNKIRQEKLKALQLTLDKIEKGYGKGTIMKLGDNAIEDIAFIPSGSIGLDLKAKLYGRPDAPMVIDFIAGLGGREINAATIGKLVDRSEEISRSGRVPAESEWVDLNRAILP